MQALLPLEARAGDRSRLGLRLERGSERVGAVRKLRLAARCLLCAVDFEWSRSGRRGRAWRGGRAARSRCRRSWLFGGLSDFERLQGFFDPNEAACVYHPHQAELQMKSRLQRGLKILEQIERDLQITGEILFGKSCGNLSQALPFLVRGGDQSRFANLRNQKIAEIARKLSAEMQQVVAVALELIDGCEHARWARFAQRGGHLVQRIE